VLGPRFLVHTAGRYDVLAGRLFALPAGHTRVGIKLDLDAVKNVLLELTGTKTPKGMLMSLVLCGLDADNKVHSSPFSEILRVRMTEYVCVRDRCCG